ncbi:MAG: helix-hairpin-helix domain-containing protein [bacterium]
MTKQKWDNRRLADVLRQMAVCYEMDGVSFKPAAYERAAETVANLAEPAATILQRGGTKELDQVEGIGPAIAEHLSELLKKGDFSEWRQCRQRMPEDVLELTAIPDLGPKKVRTLHEKLRIETVDDLDRAARRGLVRRLPGFGPKTEEKIRRGIELRRRSGGRRLLGHVLPLARELEHQLQAIGGVRQATVTGSVRRRQETIGDLDVVVTATNAKRAMDAAAELNLVEKVLERGPRNLTLRLKDDLNCDLIFVPDSSYGAAVLHFTGNRDHNVILRKLALAKKLKLNEYGLWRGKRQLACRTEREVYRKLGLPFIEPELRVGDDEVTAAQKGRLPDLLPYGAVRGDLQVQTDWTDGSASIEAMALAALERGLDYLAVTDHTRTLRMVGGLDGRGIARQAKEIDQVNERLTASKKKFVVLKGAEVNLDKKGRPDLPDSVLAKLDWVGVAVHSHFRLSSKEQTDRLIAAMRNPHVDAVFHPTTRLIGQREPIDLDLDRMLRAARETRTVLEINSFPDRTDLRDVLVRRAVEAKVKLVVSTDAHDPMHFDYLELGEATARRGWATAKDVINTRDAAALLRWLRQPKEKRR